MKKILRLGSRGSPLAMIQAQIVREAIYKAHDGLKDSCEIEIVSIRTSGDWLPEHKERLFSDMGANKGMFTKEIEEALAEGAIDLAVHSMKDVSVWTPDGLLYAATPVRADPRDAMLSPLAPRLEDLPLGARVGTSSLRRKAQLLALRPDLQIVPLRGNVDTRLRKLAAEEADATLLAVAGLSRLAMMDRVASVLDTEVMLPAPAQGILGIEIRQDDAELQALLDKVNDPATASCAKAERAMLRALDGSCRTPIAGLAQIGKNGRLHLRALAASPDGKIVIRKELDGPVSDAERIGLDVGAAIRADMPDGLFLV